MSCCVRACQKNKSEDTLFHFPIDEKLQSLWVTILKENNAVDPDWELTEDSQICINHFNDTCVIKTENDVLLTGEAYPSTFDVDYLIEEVYEVGMDSMLNDSFDQVLPNGEGNNSEEMLDNHITEEETTVEENTVEETIVQEQPSQKPIISKLKNIASEPKASLTNIQPRTIDISKRTETIDSNQHKIPMFKVVPEKPGAENKSSKDSGFKIVPDDSSISPGKPTAIPAVPSGNAKKAMQAIQIGSQYYVVSPDTPDGKELTPSQLAAIKEKLVKQMSGSKGQLNKKLTIALENPSKKTTSPKVANTKQMSNKNTPAQKKVTTIDLNKGLPKQLKEIISDKGNKKRKLDEEAETFTVSSSLDIMPVTPSKKPREDTMVQGDNRPKVADFPGSINNKNINTFLPSITIEKPNNTDTTTDEAPNRTQFYKILQDINRQLPPLNKSFWSHVYDQNQIVISKVCVVEHKPPRQYLSIVINTKLHASIYKDNSLLTTRELSELNINTSHPISGWTDVKAIIDKLNLVKGDEDQSLEFGVIDPNQYSKYINKIINVCKQVVTHGRLGIQEHDQRTVAFLCEQLSLLNESKEFRKYSINLIVFAYIMYTTSPVMYEALRKVLIIPDGALLKEIASADVSREFIHASEHRMVTLATKISGFSRKDKVVVLQMYNIKVSHVNNLSNVLMFVAASVAKTYAEVIYFCPIQDSVAINRVASLSFEIIKRLENIGMQVVAFISEYNELTFALFKQFSPRKNEKLNAVPNPVDKKRKLFLLYENASILSAICWDWMSKEFYLFPPFILASRANSATAKAVPQRATFQVVANYLKKQKVHEYYKHLNVQSISLVNQILNKDTVQVDENQKTQFTLNIFQEKLIHALETQNQKDVQQTGDFMRIIYDWWVIVSANSSRSLLKDKFRLQISDKNKEPVHKLNLINKWITIWRLQDKLKNKFSPAIFHVLGENCVGYKNLSEQLLREFEVDSFYLGTFQVTLPGDIGLVTTNILEQYKFNYK